MSMTNKDLAERLNCIAGYAKISIEDSEQIESADVRSGWLKATLQNVRFHAELLASLLSAGSAPSSEPAQTSPVPEEKIEP